MWICELAATADYGRAASAASKRSSRSARSLLSTSNNSAGLSPRCPLGHEKHRAPEGGAINIRNGTRPKTVLTDAAGQVEIEVPRDRAGTFEPVIVKKRQRRLTDVDAIAISLYAKGLTTGEISEHFAEVYGASIGKDTISRITDAVVEEMQAWCSRPLLPVYAAIFIDAIYVKVRDGQVGNQPFYAAIGVDLGATGTSWGCGPGRVVVSRRSSG